MRGKFIVIEGLEGAGKTTAHQVILKELEQAGINDVVMTENPAAPPLPKSYAI